MDREQVIAVVESLANGTDPNTGARIPQDTFHSADTIRALFAASALLKAGAATAVRRRAGSTKLTSAGAPWSTEEDEQLCREFDTKMTIGQIALQHGRSSGAITSRLVKLGRIDPSIVRSRDRGAHIVPDPLHIG
jgi:hypothetical protein